jgi:hypothetical protein
MKWVELKNYLAPTFSKEVDVVCERYISKYLFYINIHLFIINNIDLIKELQRDRYNDEYIESFLELRESIEDRIEEIENFYEMNFDQPYVQHFEKGRIKLKKLLMFEPFSINEIQVNNNNYNNKKSKVIKNTKSNAYEINHVEKNTIETNYDNPNMGNEYMFMDFGDKTNKTKKTIRYPRKEKLEFIPLDVKRKNNVHSMEKLKVPKNIKINSYMNNTRNIKYKDVDDNNIYLEEINNYNRRQTKIPNENKRYNNVINKYKKQKMSSSMDKQYINDRYNNNPYGPNTKYKRKIKYFEDDENE